VVAATIIAVVASLGLAGVGAAHDGIAGSTPESRSNISEPISEVEIDFGEDLGDDVEMFLVYDLGNAETEDIGGTVEVTGDTTATLSFDEITRTGTYFVRYLAEIPSDGHFVAGAISFTWGDPSGSESTFPWLPFLLVSAVVLSIGGYFSYRRLLVADTDDDSADVDSPETSPLL